MAKIAGLLEKLFGHRDKPPLFRLFIYAAYIVPPVAVALLTWHEMTHTQMVWSSTEITRPHDAYRTDIAEDEAWSSVLPFDLVEVDAPTRHWFPRASYKEAFLKEFSKAHFGRASRFDVFSPDMDQPSLTVILENDASSRSLLVNSISVVATLEDERPFDWRDVDVSTSLMIEAASSDSYGLTNALTFVNTGIGPILNLNADLSTDQGLLLGPFQPQAPIETREQAALWAQQPDYAGPHPDVFYDSGLSDPLYRVIDDDETVLDQWDVIDCTPNEPSDYRCEGIVKDRYERIGTVTRLGEITDVQRTSAIEVEYSFEDLKKKPYSGQQTVALPAPIYWYRWSDELLSELPFEGPIAMAPASGDMPPLINQGRTAASAYIDDAINLAKELFGVSVEGPKGVGLIKADLEIDATDIPECGFDQAIAEPRTLLQGGGFVSVSVNLNGPRNGRYQLRFLINGEERHALTLDMMVPAPLYFDGDSETTRFVSYEEEAPPQCGLSETEDASG